MNPLPVLMISACAASLAACGSHSSTAPVVYGTQPVSNARVYNSPGDLYAAPAPAAAQVYVPPPGATGVQQASLGPAPIYVASNEPVRSPPSSGAGWITVGPGDTVYAIARRTGASPQAIIAENRLQPPYALRIGDTLRVPGATAAPAPVASDRRVVIRPGDTLYSISRSSGVPVQTIAQANRLTAPYHLRVGDQLLIPGARGAVAGAKPAAPQQSVDEIARTVSYTTPPASSATRLFDWPVRGAIIGEYGAVSLGRRNEGINIAAPLGTPVRAAADGEVVYRGSELDGYGNLILIRHADGFVTAYAHNDAMLVKKGDRVRKGDMIAKVGQSGAATQPQLHFEIRQNVRSIDPMAFLNP